MQARQFEPKSFFLKFLSLALSILFLLSILVVVLTLLSRFDYLNILGASVVISDSMEPTIRRWDMVIYVNSNFTVGDVVVYCVTPSHCIVHRVADFLHLNTVNGYKTMVTAKGDNVNITDSPVEIEKVRGKVLFIFPRELWIPLLVAVTSYILYGLARVPHVGPSYVFVLCVWLLLVVSVYAAVPRLITPTPVVEPVLNLAGVYLDQASCTVSICYTGTLLLTSVKVNVNGALAEVVSISWREVVVRPDPRLLQGAFEGRRPLLVEVEAELNYVGRLYGRYNLLVGGANPELSVINGVLLVRNPNCFPIAVDVAVRYLVNSTWAWSNTTLIVEGASDAVIEPPEDAKYVYAYVYWFNQGEKRWVGLSVKTG
ncbi:MAG: signal peptidase I [Sulfolobales archaeon]